MAASFSEVQRALHSIPSDLPRDDWWKIAAALMSEFGDDGFDLFDQWSQGADSYKAADVRATWKSTNSTGGITIATLFSMAQKNGFRARQTVHKPVIRQNRKHPKSASKSAAQAYWDGAEKCASHPYAERKGLDTAGLKKYKGRLLIPAYNAAGTMSSLQKIDKNGKKKFLAGCKISGCWYTIPGDDVVVVAEGWATGKSIHAATGHTVAICFSSSGFMKVSPLLRKKYRDSRIILAPDNDESQDAVKKATQAARDCHCELIVPELEDGSDFNDLHLAVGLDAVRRQFVENVTRPRLHDLVMVNAADVEPEVVEWLWPGKFALGKLALLGGVPSTGKSTIAFSICAIVSTGGTWPFSTHREEVGRCVILTAEDDLGDTVVPRLLAAGADLSRIHIIEGVKDQRQKPFLLALHLHQLDGLLQEQPDIRLLVFDPLSAYLGAQDSHRESDVREILGPVAQLAARHHVAIIGIAHLNKNEAQSAMARFMGSGGIIAASRSAYLTASIDGHLMMLPVKNNLAPRDHASGLTYVINGVAIDGGFRASMVEWTGETDLWANEALAQEAANLRAPKLLEAKEFLADELAVGPRRETEIRAAAKEAGHAWATVRRAKGELKYQSHRTRFTGGWKWYTPDQWATYQKADANQQRGYDEHLGQSEEEPQDAQQQKYEYLGAKTPTSTLRKTAPDRAFAQGAHGTPEKAEEDHAKTGEKEAESAKALNSGGLGNKRFTDGWEAI